MTAKHLSESTLNIRKIVRKEDVTNRSVTNSIIDAIQCLINADSSNTEHVLLNIIISVTGVEVEETEKVTKKKSKKRAIVECEESVSKIQKLTESSSKPEIVNEKVSNRTKQSNKKRSLIESDVEANESIKNCTPSEKHKTSRGDLLPANTKPDKNKSSDDETRTRKNGCKRNKETNSESEQELVKKSKSSEKSEKTITKNIPVENVCRSTEQDQELVNKSKSSIQSEKNITKNIPVVGNKINTSKSTNNEMERSKNSSIESKKINFEQDEMDEECFQVFQELEEALKRRINRRSASEQIMAEKFEYLKLRKKNNTKKNSK